MKFSTTTIASFILAATISSTTTPVDAFSAGSGTGKSNPRFNPFGLKGGLAVEAPETATPQVFFSKKHLVLSAVTSSTDSSSSTINDQDVDEEVQRLRMMAAKLRREASDLEAEQASERVKAMERAFDKFDTNHDGEISLDELRAALEKTFKLDLSDDKVQRVLEDFDVSGDGKLQRDEFVSIEQFRNRLDSIACEDRRKALDATKAAQEAEERAKLIESSLDLINDREPTTTDKIVSVLPYLFPLMDGLLFGQFLLAGNESNPLVGILALLFTVYRSTPLGGFLSFFALNVLSGNLSINRLVRFNMQQAIFLDVALFIPGLTASLAGAAASSGLLAGLSIPPMVGELSSDAVFLSLIAVLGYSTVSSLLGVTPDKVPFISDAVAKRLPTADMLEFFDPTTGEPVFKNTSREADNKEEEDEEKKNQD